MNTLLSTAYWPNAHYFFYVLNSDSISIEQFENYQKQSYRNRTEILSANGVLSLSIPVEKNAPKELTKDIRISYKEHWQIRHWRAITSAYKNSPYFDYFEEDIRQFYDFKTENLLEFNLQQLKTVFRILKLKKEIHLSSDYDSEISADADLRQIIHPKLDFKADEQASSVIIKTYYQTFEHKFGFTPNLSILDLLFNTGLETIDYLGR